ncbi:MAG: glycosyltransferase [Bacilli bacterium]|nr:glycosyltransferase [Bacilli bacterium]
MQFIDTYLLVFDIFMGVYLAVYFAYLIISIFFSNFRNRRSKRRHRMHNVIDHEYFYPVSIIVPAYNEGETVVQTVKNLLKLEFRRYEIVVVDDGSTDNTKQCMLDAFPLVAETSRPIRYQLDCHTIKEVYSCRLGDVIITLVSKENGGCKSDAVNAGINICTYPFFVNMDGDEILQSDSLREACRLLLEKENVIAIGGNIKISNDVVFKDAKPVSGGFGKNPVVNMQILEYSRGFQGTRVFQDMMNANLIISGGFGVFKKEAVIKAGGYDPRSKGEDMELTVKLQHYYRKNKLPFTIGFVPSSVCWTQGPATMKDLISQRRRWHVGLMQTVGKYKDMIFNPRYGIVGMFMFPYMIIYELLSPIIMVLGLINIVLSGVLKPDNIIQMAGLFMAYVVLGVVMTLVAYLDNRYFPEKKITFKEIMTVFFYSFIDALFFRPFLAFVNLTAFFKYKKITTSKWVSPGRVKVKEEE